MKNAIWKWTAMGALACALTACGKQEADNQMAANAANAIPPAANALVTPPGMDDENAIDAAPATDGQIPLALRGSWGLVPGDCTSTRGDAKGLLMVDADSLKFYESRGTVTSIADSSENRLTADFAFMGEGQEWTRRMTLTVAGDGQTLIRSEAGPDAMPTPLKYNRCPSE